MILNGAELKRYPTLIHLYETVDFIQAQKLVFVLKISIKSNLLLWPTTSIHHLVPVLLHYTGGVDEETSPHFTSSQLNTARQRLPQMAQKPSLAVTLYISYSIW